MGAYSLDMNRYPSYRKTAVREIMTTAKKLGGYNSGNVYKIFADTIKQYKTGHSTQTTVKDKIFANRLALLKYLGFRPLKIFDETVKLKLSRTNPYARVTSKYMPVSLIKHSTLNIYPFPRNYVAGKATVKKEIKEVTKEAIQKEEEKTNRYKREIELKKQADLARKREIAAKNARALAEHKAAQAKKLLEAEKKRLADAKRAADAEKRRLENAKRLADAKKKQELARKQAQLEAEKKQLARAQALIEEKKKQVELERKAKIAAEIKKAAQQKAAKEKAALEAKRLAERRKYEEAQAAIKAAREKAAREAKKREQEKQAALAHEIEVNKAKQAVRDELEKGNTHDVLSPVIAPRLPIFTKQTPDNTNIFSQKIIPSKNFISPDPNKEINDNDDISLTKILPFLVAGYTLFKLI